jgi:hypothetical protein
VEGNGSEGTFLKLLCISKISTGWVGEALTHFSQRRWGKFLGGGSTALAKSFG